MRETAHLKVARALVAHPGHYTGVYLEMCAGVSATSVTNSLARLRDLGYARSCRPEDAKTKQVQWYPTPKLVRLLESGGRLCVPRKGAGDEPEIESDMWKPKPWIHPIRARALGIGRAA